jgi:predicted GNAT superfamily acetyltransferase
MRTDSAGSAAPTVVIRDLASTADYDACVRLQRETWGAGYTDPVPPSMLRVSQRLGGLAAGAFDAADRLVGFVYGLTGILDGTVIHWSHMLAVTPSWRGRGIGRSLKEYQRSALRGTQVAAVCWTFDPLVAAHGRRNLSRLGARVRDYLVDVYPNTGSELHAFGTDRLVVWWPVEDARPDHGLGVPGAPGAAAAALRIEVPPDILSVANRSLEQARAWRVTTRAAFTRAFAAGYRVTGFLEDRDRCCYVLERASGAASGC